MAHRSYEYIDTPDALKKAATEWLKEEEIAVDLECENNLHYYGVFISLIQVSSRHKNYIVDVLQLKNIDPVIEVFNNPAVCKIFHDTGFDLRIINHQFQCKPKNIFDTLIASQFLGKKEVGLEKLLHEYCGLEEKKNYQMADWTIRPLPKDMLEYAAKDTAYLLKVKDELCRALKEKNRLEWVLEEFRHRETLEYKLEEKGYTSFPGYTLLTDTERSILKELYNLRKEMAKKANKPPFFIISNKKMHELIKKPPEKTDDWRNMRGVHPIVRNHANEFMEAIKKGRMGSIPKPHIHRIHYTPKQSEDLKKLSEARDALSLELGIPKHLIMSKDQMQQSALNGNLQTLRNWQKKLIKEKIKNI